MTPGTTFGRRNAATTSKPRAVPQPRASDPAATAFRATVAAGRQTERSDFSGWLRRRFGRRLFAWFVGLVLLSPGAICFFLQTPWYVWVSLEVTGIGANGWLRRERRRNLQEIAAWEPSSAD